MSGLNKYFVKVASTILNVNASVIDRAINTTYVSEFTSGTRMALLFYYQAKEGEDKDSVYMSDGMGDAIHGKCVYFVRCAPAGVSINDEAQINFGSFEGSARTLPHIMRLVSEVYSPLVAKNTFNFAGKMPTKEREELVVTNERFVERLAKSVEAMECRVELPKETSHKIDNKPSAISAAAANPDVVADFENIVDEWCNICLLYTSPSPRDAHES
eukprot:3160342-Prymnesium_polylepis.2